MMKTPDFLPTSIDDMRRRGWRSCDVILVTADAYCCHPSFGVAVISRLLEAEGYKVGIISQPDWRGREDFMKLGRPELFFGVTAGNLDSMLNIYTSQMNKRRQDKYSPGGIAGLRPKLPTIVYTNKLRECFPQTPVVIGGIEASLRRLAYYDFWSDKVRRSIIFDAKADILVYGMGERQVLEIARRLKTGEKITDLNNIRGTVINRGDISFLRSYVTLPDYRQVEADKQNFRRAFNLYSRELNPFRARAVVQQTEKRFCIQLPPALPLSQVELDRVYNLGYCRRAHPAYDRFGGVPALATVETSITAHRGCAAACSFCSLSLHQGRCIQSRSIDSIVKEAKTIAAQNGFKGVISDVGGPTANMYMAGCAAAGVCARADCLWPSVCANFRQDYATQIKMLEAVSAVAGVRQVHIQSGLRYDLLLSADSQRYLRRLCLYHVSGQLKIAPEHVSDKVLRLMRKPSFKIYEKFSGCYQRLNRELGREQYLVRYFLTAHPGCDQQDAQELSRFTKSLGYRPLQVQDFIPLPMTRSSCMYYTAQEPQSGEPLYVARSKSERRLQRQLLQGR